MDSATRTKPASGPKACTTCAKAKARCIPGPAEGICERCHRLNKTCSAQTPAPPRKRKAPKPTRVAKLEKRLEDLTARVESRQALTPISPDVESPAEAEGPPRKIRRFSFPDFRPDHHTTCPGYSHLFAPDSPDSRHQQGSTQGPRIQVQHTQGSNTPVWNADGGHELGENQQPPRVPGQLQFPQSVSSSTSSSSNSMASSKRRNAPQRNGGAGGTQGAQLRKSPGRDLSESDEGRDPWYYPSPDEAQQFLQDAKDHFVPLFPFIVIPPNTSAETLRRDRPLLWKAIMFQGMHLHARRQVLVGDTLLKDIVTAAFIQPSKSLDLLQAVECFTAWSHSSAKSFELTNLLFLMRSICVSLGFNESQEFSKQQSPSIASLEQMRAYTGVYYLVTMVFTTNKKPDAFMNTTYLDHCCRVLEERMEYESDQLVVLLVRTQQLSQSISMTLAFRNNQDSVPLPLIVKSFQHEIRQLRSTVPEYLKDNAALSTQMHIAGILLYEVGISEDLSAGLAPPDRLELLWECLIAARSMLEARFKEPQDIWPRTISLSSFDFTYAMLVCLKLSLLQLPGWDLRVVRAAFEFDKYLMLILEDLRKFTLRRGQRQTIEDADGPPPADGTPRPAQFQDPYMHLYSRLCQLRLTIRAELAATLPPEAQQTKETGDVSSDAALVNGETGASGPDTGAALGESFPDGFDDLFSQDGYKSNEWEMNFSTLLGWGFDDATIPNYTDWTSNMPS